MAKPARSFALEVNRIKSEFLGNPTEEQRLLAVQNLEKTPLSSVTGCDGKTITAVLTALVAMQVPGSAKIVDDCAQWVAKHLDSLTENGVAITAFSLVSLGYPRADDMLAVLETMVAEKVAVMSATAAAMVFNAYAAFPTAKSEIPKNALSRVQAQMDTVSLNDVIKVLEALAKPQSTVKVSVDLIDEVMIRVEELVASGGSLTDMATLLALVADVPENPAARDRTAAFLLEELVKQRQHIAPAMGAQVVAAWKGKSESSSVASKITEELKTTYDVTADGGAASLANKDLGKLLLVEKDESELQGLVDAMVRRFGIEDEQWSSKGVEGVLAVVRHKAPEQFDDWLKKFLDGGAAKNAEALSQFLKDESVLKPHHEAFRACIEKAKSHWNVSDYTILITSARNTPCAEIRELVRAMAPDVAKLLPTAAVNTVVSLIDAYGALHVRNDEFCTAAEERALQIRRELSPKQLSMVLGGFSMMDYRHAKIFVDLVPQVRACIHALRGPDVVVIAAVYAKMLVWNYKLFARLADQALERRMEIDLHGMCTLLHAFHRIELHHDRLFKGFLKKAHEAATSADLTTDDALMLLTAFSKVGIWDPAFYAALCNKVATDPTTMTADTIGTMLMALSRVHLEDRRWFEALALRAVEVAPTAGPAAIANIITAYATVGCRHVELFTVLADRALAIRNECPALTVAAVLIAFAKVELRNDKLFIEMIPRVRYVAHHGSVQDVANVLTAYSSVGLWHYKLFVRLAERAISLRGECKSAQIVSILAAFAKVEMRYEKLFTELSPRIQSMMHVLSAPEMASILNSYASVKVLDVPIFNQIAERCVALKDEVDDQSKKKLVQAMGKMGFNHTEFQATFGKFEGETAATKKEATA